MKYTQLAVICIPREPLAEILISELADIGFESFEESKNGFRAYIPGSDFSLAAVEQILEAKKGLGEISFLREEIPDQNWNASWEASYPMVEIGTKCVVRAPFHTTLGKHYDLELIIQPQMSFGTGHHETTTLMLEHLLAIDLSGASVLDMGSGTGVLAIAAAKRGAESVMAIDIEEWAYKNSLENAALNDVSIIVEKGDVALIKGQSFDFIFANINKNVLLADMQQYALSLKSGGILFLSGFFTSDSEEIMAEALKHHLRDAVQTERKGWASLRIIKVK